MSGNNIRKINGKTYGKTYGVFILFIFFLAGCSSDQAVSSLSDLNDPPEMIRINEVPTFIVGSYYLPDTDNPYKTLSTNGFNYFRANADTAVLDSADKYGLKTWIHLGSIDADKVGGKSRNDIVSKLEAFKDHPALLCWELEDEPAYIWNSANPRILPEQLLETYEVVKSIDSKHMVYMNHAPVNLVSTMQKYNGSADILACDIYPVIPHGIRPSYALFADGLQGDRLNPYISQVGEYVQRLKNVSDDKPLFMIMQGFAWEMLKPETEREQQMIVYPTYDQLRFMAYNAIIHEVNGIIYWGTKYTPPGEPFWDDLFKVTREIKGMQAVLTAPRLEIPLDLEYHELGYSVDGGVELLVKKVKDSFYLLTANIDNHPAKVSFHKLAGYTLAEVLMENREIQLTGETLTDHFEAFDVHVYKLTKTTD